MTTVLEEDTENCVPALVEFTEKFTVKFILSYGGWSKSGLYCTSASDWENVYTTLSKLIAQKLIAIIFSIIYYL